MTPCQRCGDPLPEGSTARRLYCSQRCRQSQPPRAYSCAQCPADIEHMTTGRGPVPALCASHRRAHRAAPRRERFAACVSAWDAARSTEATESATSRAWVRLESRLFDGALVTDQIDEIERKMSGYFRDRLADAEYEAPITQRAPIRALALDVFPAVKSVLGPLYERADDIEQQLDEQDPDPENRETWCDAERLLAELAAVSAEVVQVWEPVRLEVWQVIRRDVRRTSSKGGMWCGPVG